MGVFIFMGKGHLYHRKYKAKDGTIKEYSTYTYKFYHNNKQMYYNTGETNKRKAWDKALSYRADVTKGSEPWEYNKTTFEDLKEWTMRRIRKNPLSA